MIEIYSKPGCGYCEMAKTIFEKNGVQYEEHVVGSTISRDDFFRKFPSVKTVPQIVIAGAYVGGYDNLIEWMKHNDLSLLKG